MRRLAWRLLVRLLDRVDARVCAWSNTTDERLSVVHQQHNQEQPT